MATGAAAKAALRRALLGRRRLLTDEDAQEAAAVLAGRALELPELADAGTVAAYVSIGREPGTRVLLDSLRARGVRVLLPVLLADNDLDWAAYEGLQALEPAGRGLLEPTGPRLGVDAVREADAVLLPGLAVDGRGMRLGRGGGSYDRVLARLERARRQARETPGDDRSQVQDPPHARTRARVAAVGAARLVVLLYANEVVAEVPVEPHDHPVHAVVTPAGVRRFD
ncbi:5-formyltetrahydrofolate cyclo-ligase [Streptomyces sp. NPDC058657]|uniref:5-formyltetrahydrofolate cyclo-ligase n=1 Tax=unclassified Streptomyces TaxID=2593676 RepID=UPI00364DF821